MSLPTPCLESNPETMGIGMATIHEMLVTASSHPSGRMPVAECRMYNRTKTMQRDTAARAAMIALARISNPFDYELQGTASL